MSNKSYRFMRAKVIIIPRRLMNNFAAQQNCWMLCIIYTHTDRNRRGKGVTVCTPAANVQHFQMLKLKHTAVPFH